jgi:sugar lactone lactonase YvrE
MTRRALVTLTFALALGLSASSALAQSWPNSVELQIAPDIPGVIAGGTMPEVVVKGLTSADDPLWIPNVGLIFSESQANRIVRLDENDKPVTFIGDLLNPLGMTLDGQGQLISIQTRPGMMGPRIVWPKGKEKIVADNFEGKPFGRPNDIIADKKGGLYFTDPPGNPQGGVPSAVYYVPPGGSAAIRVTDQAGRPNGLQLSFDEKTLYVNDTGGIHLYAFDVQADGRLANRRIFATYSGRTTASTPQVPVSAADGLTTDDQGRLYALTEAGIEVVSPAGHSLGIIPVWCITRRCQNLGFGGPDKRTLYIAGGGTLIRIPMLARGYAERVK